MASLDDLDDRQRAVLQLLLTKGKSYDDLAELLRTDASGVRARAHGAVEALGPDSPDVDGDRRREIADYLLGQQTASQRAATREYLEGSAAGRAWARSAAAALSPLASDTLPDIPAEREEVAEAFDALDRRSARQQEVKRSSQLGAVLVAAGIGLVLAIVIIVVLSLGDETKDGTATTTPGSATSPATTTPSGEDFQVLAQGALAPPSGTDSKAKGQVAIVRFPDNDQFRLALQAEGLPPSSTRGSAYGVWFYSSEDRKLFVGFPDTVVGQDGVLETVADLTATTSKYERVLLTRETSKTPKSPGTVILESRLVFADQQPGATQTQTTP